MRKKLTILTIFMVIFMIILSKNTIPKSGYDVALKPQDISQEEKDLISLVYPDGQPSIIKYEPNKTYDKIEVSKTHYYKGEVTNKEILGSFAFNHEEDSEGLLSATYFDFANLFIINCLKEDGPLASIPTSPKPMSDGSSYGSISLNKLTKVSFGEPTMLSAFYKGVNEEQVYKFKDNKPYSDLVKMYDEVIVFYVTFKR